MAPVCPRCTRKAKRQHAGYCSRVHWELDHKRPKKVIVECNGCGTRMKRASSAIPRSGRAFCKRCKRAKGEDHPKWKGGQYINRDGYRMVFFNGYYQREHRIVWEQNNRASLLKGTFGSIHHIDFNKLNNSPDNLLLVSNEEHSRLHRFIDAGRKKAAARLLQRAALRQLYYPAGVDEFIVRMFSE